MYISNYDRKYRTYTRLGDAIPDNLRYICDLADSEEGYTVEHVLNYLIHHMFECDSVQNYTSPYQVLQWIDYAFERAFFEPENDDAWKQYESKIRIILHRADELLKRYAPRDYHEGYRTTYAQSCDVDYVEIAQKLNVYYAFYYMYIVNGTKNDIRDSLRKVLEDTKRNTQELLEQDNAETIIEMDDWDDEFHYPHEDRWITLNWIARSWLPNRGSKILVANTLEDYAEYLMEKTNSVLNTAACHTLQLRTESRLRDVCEEVIEDITEGYEDGESPEALEAEAMIEAYEKMIAASEYRDAQIRTKPQKLEQVKYAPNNMINEEETSYE